MEELKMDVRLTTKGQIEAHDLQTKFAVSSMAPGMKALCKFAVSNGNHIDAEGILEIGMPQIKLQQQISSKRDIITVFGMNTGSSQARVGDSEHRRSALR